MTTNPRPETPVTFKHTESSAYRAGNLDTSRLAFLHDQGKWIPMVPLQTFIDNILPLVPDIDVKKTQKVLRQKNITTDKNAAGKPGWTGVVEPSKSTHHEDLAFKFLDDIYRSILNNVQFKENCSYRKPTLEYIASGHSTPASIRNNTSKPDGFCRLTDTEHISTKSVLASTEKITDGTNDKGNWLDIGLVDEYKKAKTAATEYDNIQKVLWSLHHIMRNDPRRRAAFGLTMENTTTKLWYCNRQTLLVSKPFDIMTDHDQFIYLAISLFFGKTSDLGWDPTVKLRRESKNWVYDIKVYPRQDEKTKVSEVLEYSSLGFLSNYRADSIRGRATRVYKAVPKGETNGTTFVTIKDVWIDSDRQTEDDILKEILQKIPNDSAAKERFLTCIASGGVPINGQVDNTQTTGMRGLEINRAVRLALGIQDDNAKLESTPVPVIFSRYSIETKTEKKTKDKTMSVGLHSSVDRPANSRRNNYQFHPKDHHRIVFAEVGENMESMIDKGMNAILQICIGAIQALEAMYQAGYVHRDVTVGNIICVDMKAKLIDLENAKKINAKGYHDVRTATADFIAFEVEEGQYSYNREIDPETTEFLYNPLHDLESIWWILIYFCTFYTLDKQPGSDLSLMHATGQLNWGCRIFPQDSNTSLREAVFGHPRALKYRFKDFSFPVLIGHLALAAGDLYNAYLKAEEGLSNTDNAIDETAFVGIHAKFIEHLVSAKKEKTHNEKMCKIDDFIRRSTELAE